MTIKTESPIATIKWRKDEPPYIEIRTEGGEMLVAGWVHPTPTRAPTRSWEDYLHDYVHMDDETLEES